MPGYSLHTSLGWMIVSSLEYFLVNEISSHSPDLCLLASVSRITKEDRRRYHTCLELTNNVPNQATFIVYTVLLFTSRSLHFVCFPRAPTEFHSSRQSEWPPYVGYPSQQDNYPLCAGKCSFQDNHSKGQYESTWI